MKNIAFEPLLGLARRAWAGFFVLCWARARRASALVWHTLGVRRRDRAFRIRRVRTPARGAPAKAAEPRPESHLVARVAGEDALRDAPYPLTEDRLGPPPTSPDEPNRWDEGLGELPGAYEDDAVVALARDPNTLWLFWDFARATVEDARRGLIEPRVRLRVFEQGRLVREIDLALESRSFYVSGLSAGHTFTAELVFVAQNGERLIGRSSNPMALPPKGPSPIVDDRFATLPWGLPLARRFDLFADGMSLPPISNSERDALRAASQLGNRLGASEQARRLSGGGSMSARAWSPR